MFRTFCTTILDRVVVTTILSTVVVIFPRSWKWGITIRVVLFKNFSFASLPSKCLQYLKLMNGTNSFCLCVMVYKFGKCRVHNLHLLQSKTLIRFVSLIINETTKLHIQQILVQNYNIPMQTTEYKLMNSVSLEFQICKWIRCAKLHTLKPTEWNTHFLLINC